MKATEPYFPVVLVILLYRMVLAFESVDQIQKVRPNESFGAELSCGIVLVCLFCFVLYCFFNSAVLDS